MFCFFDNWNKVKKYTDIADVYFQIFRKENQESIINGYEGSIELWVKPTESKSGKYQRLIIDNKWNIELGIDPDGNLYFYPSQAPQKNYNLIFNPLNDNEWNHIIVTWDFGTKEVNFYINGEKIDNDINNVSQYWTEVAKPGDLQIGGTSLNIESVFVGYIDGIRIYKKVLTEKEIFLSYKYNKLQTRIPDIRWLDEELVFKKILTDKIDDLSLLKNLPTTDKVKILLCYAGVFFRKDFDYFSYYYLDQKTNKKIFLIPKYSQELERLRSSNNYTSEKKFPILGIRSSDYDYGGTDIKISDRFLLVYIGLNINNLDLIKEFEVVLSQPSPFIKSYLKKNNKNNICL